MKRLKEVKWETLMTGILYIGLGIVSLVIPVTMIKTVGYILGIVLILAGAVSMICYLIRDARQNYYHNEFLIGLIAIAAGIFVLNKVELIVSLIPFLLGLMVLLSGCAKLQDVIDMKRMEYGNWMVVLILAVVNVVTGILLVCNPFKSAVLLFRLIGVGLIFSGITDCCNTIYFAGKLKRYLESLQAVDSTCTEIVETGSRKRSDPEAEDDK